MIKKFTDFINEDFTDLYKRWKKKEVRKEDKDNTNYVDLGLPSGTLWADRNLGADSPEDYGDYYAWGETETKDEYSRYTYKWGEDCIKYNKEDGKKVLDPEDDVVYVRTKGKAHIPTKEQIKELLDNTTSKKTTINGVKGELYISKVNDNSIFLPYAGYQNGSFVSGEDIWSRCWSSSLDLDNTKKVYYLNSNITTYSLNTNIRYWGFSVRGVKDKK